MKEPKVSVIMNCLNSEQYLREAIDSVYAQTFKNWEIILWDNASTDSTAEIAKTYDKRLRYFRSEGRSTLGKVRNCAIKKASGEFVAFLDGDDIWLPEKLSSQIVYFQGPQVGVVYSDWILFYENGYRRKRWGKRKAPQGWVFEKILFNNFTCFSTVVVRTSILKESRINFDPRLSYLEDTDLLVQIARKWKFAYDSRALTQYRIHSASASATSVEGFRDEMDALIDKYCTLFSEFTEKYAQRLRDSNQRDRAVDFWRRGDGRKARALIRDLCFQELKYFIVYLAFFLPASLVDTFRKKLFNLWLL